MALDLATRIALAQQYAPVMYFHPEERFFPSDPKRYLEQCALWRVRGLGLTTSEWGEEPPGQYPRSPLQRPSTLAATAAGNPPGTKWLGDLLAGAGEDRFLSLGGWVGSGPVVDVATDNRFASIDDVLRVYEGPLEDSHFWFYAEVLDKAELYGRAGPAPTPAGAMSASQMLDVLNEPLVVLYHLFYPAHEEPLEGCEAVGSGAAFATYAGEWACIAVLEQEQYDDAGDPIGRAPTHLGLTQRNIGALQGRGDDARIAMQTIPWAQVSTLADHPTGPQVVVARGTHSMYADVEGPTQRPVRPVSSDRPDIGRGSCGKVEEIDDALVSLEPPTTATPGGSTPYSEAIVEVKIALALSSLFVPAAMFVEMFLELELAIIATNDDPFRLAETPRPSPHPQAVDVTPTPGDHGVVVAPEGVTIDGRSTAVKRWRISEEAAPGGVVTGADGRTYGFIVDRASQVWWSSTTVSIEDIVQQTVGYDGRWGEAVTHDPRGRRSGMRHPDLLLPFVTSLAKSK